MDNILTSSGIKTQDLTYHRRFAGAGRITRITGDGTDLDVSYHFLDGWYEQGAINQISGQLRGKPFKLTVKYNWLGKVAGHEIEH